MRLMFTVIVQSGHCVRIKPFTLIKEHVNSVIHGTRSISTLSTPQGALVIGLIPLDFTLHVLLISLMLMLISCVSDESFV